MRSQATILELQKVSKRYGKTEALKDISFKVAEGEIYGLIGPNGSGKTTVLKTIAGHLRPDSGRIFISGYDQQKEFADAVDFVGAMVEYPAHYPYMTGRQNLSLTANMYPEISKGRIQEVVELVGLQSHIDQKVRHYSLGMRQRLALAESILPYPQVMLLDEPMNGLDPIGLKELTELLKGLSANGMAILVTSHILEQMDRLCDKIGILANGYLIAERDMEEFRNRRNSLVDIQVSDVETARRILEERFGDSVAVLEASEHILTLELADAEAWEINRLLLTEGQEVSEIHSRRQTLEELYTSLTGGAEIE